MSHVPVLIARAHALGAILSTPDGLTLEVDAPDDFPDSLVEQLRAAKPALLAVLRPNPTETERVEILAWSTTVGEQAWVLTAPIKFHETPLRPVWVADVSRYVRERQQAVVRAGAFGESGGWGRFTPEWWGKIEEEAMGALSALKQAMESTNA